MPNNKNMKRFGVLVFSLGFGLMMFGDPFHFLGGALVLISVWLDTFVQEQVDAYFDQEMHRGHDTGGYHGNNGSDLQHEATVTST